LASSRLDRRRDALRAGSTQAVLGDGALAEDVPNVVEVQ
jgi:hypothetical protein